MATKVASGTVSSMKELRAILAGERAFAGLSDGALESLAHAAEREVVPAGHELLGPGVVPDSAFVVMHGRLRVTDARVSEQAGREVFVELGRGGVAGLNLLVAQIPSAGTLSAMRDTTVLRLRREALLQCFSKHPELYVAQARHFYETALHTHAKAPAIPRIVTLLPVRGGFALDDVLRLSARALTETFGPIEVVDSRRAAEILGGSPERGGESLRARMSDWIGEQEEGGRLVLLVCDREATLWTRWSLEQTDRIVVAASPGDRDAIAYVDRILASRRTRSKLLVDILLVHPADVEVPRGTRPWVDLPYRRRHHHVRVDRLADFRRAARRLAERGVSVVLGGGGARALAHIGLLQALEEAGVPVDAIGGTSMGSVVAAAYACGRSPAEMLRLFRERVPDGRALRDVDFPALSLFSGRKLDELLRFAFEDLDVSDAWIPCFCVSADIAGARMVVHDRGPLWEAVRASCSLPGVFPPVYVDDSLLVDGGVMDNVPIAVMEREHAGSTIIACDVGAAGIGPIEKPRSPHRSGWSRLGDRFRGRGAESVAPNIVHVLTSATMLGSRDELHRMVDEGHADLLLVPPVQHVKVLGFEARESLYRIGYEHARQALAGWSELARIRTHPRAEDRAVVERGPAERGDRPR
jgi:NTE family protein